MGTTTTAALRKRYTFYSVSPELLGRHLAASTTANIKEDALSTMASCGVDLTSEAGTAYIDGVVAARQAANQTYLEVLAEAKAHGYDPQTCGSLISNSLETTGAVSWATPASEGEGT